MRTEKSLGPVDWLALVVFMAGSFGLVLMGLSAISGEELAAPHGTARVAIEWIAAIGLAPSLLFNAAVAYLGARTFLRSHARGLLRDFVGSAAVALGASVACGVFAAGGALGEATGGALASSSNKALAAIAGAFAIVLPAWFAWLRAAAIKPTPLVKPDATGVGGAETAELAGDDEVRALAQATIAAAPAPASAATRSVRDPLAHPYPEDARLRGEIPPGTKPLIVSASTPVEAVEIQGLAGDFDASFADEPVMDEPVVPRPLVPRPLEPQASNTATLVEIDVQSLEPSASELAEAIQTLESGATADLRDEVEVPSPIVPSWERTGLSSEDEPVDAYGTPLSLVEKVRAEVAGKSAEPEVQVEGQSDLDALEAELLALEQSQAIEEQRASSLLSAVEDELAEAEVVHASDSIELAVFATDPTEAASTDAVGTDAVAAEVVSTEVIGTEVIGTETVDLEVVHEGDELEVDESEFEIDELAISDEGAVEPVLDAPVRVAAEIGFDEQPASEGLDEAAVEAVPAAASTLAPIDAVVDEAVGEAADAPKRSSRKKNKAPVEVEAPGLFDGGLYEVEAVGELATSASAETQADAQTEPQVELQPQVAAPGASIKQLALDPSRRDLLDEVGCLFVERGRVAVSMLQKQYGMDFDDACVVLDDLQELGLIGPYLGGQRRDILLTRDQWKERLAKA